jgi:ribosomal protein S18 acetylase RimI-like enzyme
VLAGADQGCIVTIEPASVDDVPRVAELHATRIHEGFLAGLGPRFLRLLYRRAVVSPHAFVLVAAQDGRAEGFVAGCCDLRRFYRSFLARDGWRAGLVAAPRLIRSLRKVVETLRYPSAAGALPDAEVLAVAVDAARAGQGVGRRLVEAATEEFRARGVREAKVVAGAGNGAALRLYERCGFVPRRRIAVHHGDPSEVLVWPSS